MKKRGTVLAIALLATSSSLALAGEGKAGRWFDRLDTNSDGVITQGEMEARRSERFAKIDADGDGMIALEEYNAQAQERFARADRDGNGEISKEEFTQIAKEWRKKHKRSDKQSD